MNRQTSFLLTSMSLSVLRFSRKFKRIFTSHIAWYLVFGGLSLSRPFLIFFITLASSIWIILQCRYISRQIIKRQTLLILFCQKLYDIYFICLHGTDTPFTKKFLPLFEYWFVLAFSFWGPGCRDGFVSCFQNLVCWCFLEQ